MRFQTLAAQLALATMLLAVLTALGAMAGVRLAGIPYDSGVTVMVGATVLGGVALGFALAWLASALKRNKGEGKRAGMIALVGSLLLLWPPLNHVYRGLTSPVIYDATTNPEDPPEFVVLAKTRQPGMNSPVYDGGRQISFRGESNTAAYMLHTYYPMLFVGLPQFIPMPQMFWRAFEAAKDEGWSIVDFNEKEGRIEATDTSFWFGQTADIVIRVRPAGRMGARLDVRSQSRSGARDNGSNIARLESFLETFQNRR